MITSNIQRHSVREPRQERSRYKVRLMLEATIRLLEKGGAEALTTNAVAATAGVSIGTLYQFFPNKEALLDTLADRELAAMAERVMRVMRDSTIISTEERIAGIVRAVASTYGNRRKAHKVVMAYSLARGGNRLSSLMANMIELLSKQRDSGPIRRAFDRADAFVLAHGFAGVLRAMINAEHDGPSQAAIETALARMVMSFVG